MRSVRRNTAHVEIPVQLRIIAPVCYPGQAWRKYSTGNGFAIRFSRNGRIARPRWLEQKRPPGLAVVLVGSDPASEIYVRNKIKACEQMGVYSEKHTPPDSVSTEELLALVESLNRREEIDGILVQMPLPKQVDSRRILVAIRPGQGRGRISSGQCR